MTALPSVSQILNVAWTGTIKHWKSFLGLLVPFALASGITMALSSDPDIAKNSYATIYTLFYIVYSLWFSVVFVRMSYAVVSGKPAVFATANAGSWSRVLPLVGITILTGLGVLFASFLFIIPGIILWLAWYAAHYLVIVDNMGVFASLKKSAAMTKGRRWPLLGRSLGTGIIISLGYGIPTLIVTLVMLGIGSLFSPMVQATLLSIVYVVIYIPFMITAQLANVEIFKALKQ